MPFKYELTKSHYHKILSEYMSGKPLVRIAREQGVSVSVIRRVLREHGIVPKLHRPAPSRQRMTEEQRGTAVQMRREGKTLREIAELFGVSPVTIFLIEADHYATSR